jgi:hypothetical protein
MISTTKFSETEAQVAVIPTPEVLDTQTPLSLAKEVTFGDINEYDSEAAAPTSE